MLLLSNGCTASNPTVCPKNYKSPQASTKKLWFIHYRFYDPSELKDHPQGKQIMIAGFNRFNKLADRRAAVNFLLTEITDALINKGYNPIKKTFSYPNLELSPDTPFIHALKYAEKNTAGVHGTKLDIASVIRGVELSAKELGINNTPICEVSRKHIKMILQQCFKNNPRFTAGRFNKYKAYLSKLFVELVEMEAAEYNPTRDIKNMKETKKTRLTLTEKERQMVYDHLYRVNRPFLNFVELFYHSGGRTTELLNLRGRDVNMETQKYTVTIKKGRFNREVSKTIKDIAVPFWNYFVQNCAVDEYLFGKGLQPDKMPISPAQITRRWEIWVKRDLGIKADFYSLKHSNTSEVVNILDNESAAKMNSHTSTAMVVDIYDTQRKNRQHEQLKKISNKFAG